MTTLPTPRAADPEAKPARTPRAPLPRNVRALAAVSLLTDLSSEMIYPLLPVFLGTTLGASARFVGVVEGAAESTAALLKLASGWWSDRVRRRKPLVVAGYLLASVARPLVAAAQSAGHVLAIRLVDRVGKGIRSSPRDALIADSVHPAERGRAFGFHRAADHLGAVVGPLVAFALMRWGGAGMRTVFWLAAVPAAAAVLVLLVGVREKERAGAPQAAAPAGGPPHAEDALDTGDVRHQSAPRVIETVQGGPPGAHASAAASPRRHATDADVAAAALPRRFWLFVGAVLLFTLGNSTDAFLLLRASQLGVATALVPVLWSMLHVVKSASSTPGGALSDRLGRKPLIVAGWLLYAVVYFAFGRATDAWHAWALFAIYGVFFGLTEGTEKALVADLVPATRRGAAFGWYNLAVGLAALPASVIFGAVWDRAGAPAAFGFGALMALVAALLVAAIVPGAATASR